MKERVLQINFKYSAMRTEYEELASSLGQSFADVPGLVWKIWNIKDAESEAGGIYYFEDEESLNGFLGSQLAADVKSHPAVSEFSAKTFEVMDTVTAVTRGPVTLTAAL